MLISRVVKLSKLSKYFEKGLHRTWLSENTVNEISSLIAKESETLSFTHDTASYVFVRYKESLRDRAGVLPFTESGGALTDTDPKDLISQRRKTIEECVPAERKAGVRHSSPTITTFWDGSVATLTYNLASDF